MKRHTTGFTLIELMITMAIIAILAAVAIPSYMNYVKRGARSAAEGDMLNMAQTQERYFTNNNTYVAVAAPPTAPLAGFQNYSGGSSAARKYDITVAAGPTGSISTSFTVSATPSNGYSDTTCTTLTLDSTGAKGSAKGNASPCW
ncbi:type IV pilin protein [Collimonas silvisoli]|uniref:type IV pilin protein n=1 Tax=Collimonas silvisoli TaxID=2825884 RepID=UPI001B8B19D3|nr:type IV pilin protein [Collimonas silvisoli]